MENINNNMDLLNTEKLENDFSNFTVKDLFSKEAAKRALAGGNPLAAIQYANKQDKLKANQKVLEAQIEAAKANKDLVLAQQKTQELQAAKNKAEEDATKAIDEARANSNVRTSSLDTSDDGKILGLPKVAFWIGIGVVVLGAGFATYKIIKNRNK